MKKIIVVLFILYSIDAFCCNSERECVRSFCWVSSVSTNHTSFNNAPACVRSTPPDEVEISRDAQRFSGPLWIDCYDVDILNLYTLCLNPYCDDAVPADYGGSINYYTEAFSHCGERQCFDGTDIYASTEAGSISAVCERNISWGSDKRAFSMSIQINSQCHNGVGYWWKGTKNFAAGEYPDRGDANAYLEVIPQGVTTCENGFRYNCINS